ncbi:hypothetical protein PENANT_c015G01869 [Penicillium antarcticum]|uniref:Uncharacterized protein n=1 Tax=Penicillium antarcticum TaxID=416450 RepID=A0A1V6Q4W5_9EURO|nr:hypothetical protein PENANT_c015G01869 [Penicillium antarcticum]
MNPQLPKAVTETFEWSKVVNSLSDQNFRNDNICNGCETSRTGVLKTALGGHQIPTNFIGIEGEDGGYKMPKDQDDIELLKAELSKVQDKDVTEAMRSAESRKPDIEARSRALEQTVAIFEKMRA